MIQGTAQTSHSLGATLCLAVFTETIGFTHTVHLAGIIYGKNHRRERQKGEEVPQYLEPPKGHFRGVLGLPAGGTNTAPRDLVNAEFGNLCAWLQASAAPVRGNTKSAYLLHHQVLMSQDKELNQIHGEVVTAGTGHLRDEDMPEDRSGLRSWGRHRL